MPPAVRGRLQVSGRGSGSTEREGGADVMQHRAHDSQRHAQHSFQQVLVLLAQTLVHRTPLHGAALLENRFGISLHEVSLHSSEI